MMIEPDPPLRPVAARVLLALRETTKRHQASYSAPLSWRNIRWGFAVLAVLAVLFLLSGAP